MTRKVVFSSAAVRDPAGIREYLQAQRGRSFAQDVVNGVRQAVNALKEHPHLGRPGHEPDTRELVTEFPYVIVYRITVDEPPSDRNLGSIQIVRIWHGAQDRTPPAISRTPP